MKKILLIEDNAEMRENTAEILELAQYEVITAANGKIGVDLALEENPDLIICDIMMPVLDGYGVLHLLSKNESMTNIPFIFLTAKAERTELRKGMEMGADDYLTKPFDAMELLTAVESRLNKSERLKKVYAKSLDGLNEFISSAKQIDELSKISAEREIRSYGKKENIYEEGSHPHGMYFLSAGRVKTFRSHELGKELITGLYKEGDFFGYLALLEESPHTDSAQTLEHCDILCFIPKDDFFSLLFRHSDVSKKFMRLLSDNLEEKEERLVKLAYNSVRKRVAEALLTLHDRYKDNSNTEFAISISRDDLANLAGTATETTIRTLSNFKEEGLIGIRGAEISIHNYKKLAAMRC